jgi:hypothetical protein
MKGGGGGGRKKPTIVPGPRQHDTWLCDYVKA